MVIGGRFGGVMVTGAFLAETASVVDNKLNVSGGVLSRFMVGPDRLARFVLVVLTEAEVGDLGRRVDVEVRAPTGEEPQRLTFDVPEASVTAEFPGFACFQIDIGLPVDGRWVFVVTGDAGAISLPLVVSD